MNNARIVRSLQGAHVEIMAMRALLITLIGLIAETRPDIIDRLIAVVDTDASVASVREQLTERGGPVPSDQMLYASHQTLLEALLDIKRILDSGHDESS